MTAATSNTCWWCRSRQADSREHRWPRAVIERLYGSGSYASADGPLHFSGEIQRQVRSAGARLLTYRSALCRKCNNERSQALDAALIALFEYVIVNSEQLSREQRIDFAELYGIAWSSQVDLLLRAFAKDLGCRFVNSGMTVPAEIVALLDEGWEAHPNLAAYIDLNLGVLATFEDTSKFLGKSDFAVVLSSDKGIVRAASYFYNVSYIRCFIGYRYHDRLVNVDRIHPKKQAIYVSWGSVLSEQRLLNIRAVDRGLGWNDIVDISGQRAVEVDHDRGVHAGPAK